MNWLELVSINKSKKIYALVDCDSFFASCEVFRNPKLEWKPVCIWRHNDIILAATKEAKIYWINTWTPAWEAEKILKNIIFIEPDFDFYKKISQNLMNYLRWITLKTEVFSIDEAFIDITWLDLTYNLTYAQLIHKLKLAIKKYIWIPVSIWASYTKLLAKMFVRPAKPFWTFFETDEKYIDWILGKMKLRDIPFIWRGWEQRFKYACSSALDFKNLNYSYVERIMGKSWIKLWFELNWIDNLKFEARNIPKSISRTHSFHPNFTNNYDTLWKEIIKNFEKAFETAVEDKVSIGWIILFLRKKDFTYSKWEYYFPFNIIEKEIIIEKLKIIFNEIYNDELIRGTWVIFTNLENCIYTHTNLFSWNTNFKKEKLYKIINNINLKFWHWAITTLENKEIKKIDKTLDLFWEVG